MKKFIKIFRFLPLKLKMMTIYSFFQFPWFIIHELSHVIAILFTGATFTIEKFELMVLSNIKHKNYFNITYYNLTFDVNHCGSIFMMIIASAPTITYILIQYYILMLFIETHSILLLILAIYNLLSIKIANMSSVDVECFIDEYKKI